MLRTEQMARESKAVVSNLIGLSTPIKERRHRAPNAENPIAALLPRAKIGQQLREEETTTPSGKGTGVPTLPPTKEHGRLSPRTKACRAPALVAPDHAVDRNRSKVASSDGCRRRSGHRTEYAITPPPRSALLNMNRDICEPTQQGPTFRKAIQAWRDGLGRGGA